MTRGIDDGIRGKVQRSIDAQIRLDELEKTLAKGLDVLACWRTICAFTREFGFRGVRMAVSGTVFEDYTTRATDRLWQLRIPLGESQYINLYCDCGADTNPVILSAFAEAVERGLRTCPALHCNGTEVTPRVKLSLIAADFMSTPLLAAGAQPI